MNRLILFSKTCRSVIRFSCEPCVKCNTITFTCNCLAHQKEMDS